MSLPEKIFFLLPGEQNTLDYLLPDERREIEDLMRSSPLPSNQSPDVEKYRRSVYGMLRQSGFDQRTALDISYAIAVTDEEISTFKNAEYVFDFQQFMGSPILHQALGALPTYRFPGQSSVSSEAVPLKELKSRALAFARIFIELLTKKDKSAPIADCMPRMGFAAQAHALQCFFDLVTAQEILKPVQCLFFVAFGDLFKNTHPFLKAALICNNFHELNPADPPKNQAPESRQDRRLLNFVKSYVSWVKNAAETSSNAEELQKKLNDTQSSLTHPITQALRGLTIKRQP